MPGVTISEAMYARLTAFTDVIEAVIEEETSLEDCAELILDQGIASMLTDLLGPLEPDVLLKSFQQLATQYPEQVYQYVAETLREGGIELEREKLRHKLGFRTPANTQDGG